MKYKLSVILLSLTFIFATVVVSAQDDNDIVDIDSINDDPMSYVGEVITIQDDIVEAITPRIFIVEHDTLFESDRVLVINNSASIDGIDIRQLADNDVQAQITGTIEQFVLGDIYEEYTPDVDFDFFQDTFSDYDGAVYLRADEITLLEEVDMDDMDDVSMDLSDILDNPAEFVDQEVIIEEQFVEYLSPNVYVIEDKDFFNPERIVVIITGENTINDLNPEILADDDPEVFVTGIARAFDLEALEGEFEVELDNDYFSDYEDLIIVAESIVLNEDLDEDLIEEAEISD